MDKNLDDPYEILGIPYDATDSDAKKAYRKLALKYHPDKQGNEEDRNAAHDIFAKLADAFDTVSDPVKRYDWKQSNPKSKMKHQQPNSSNNNNGFGVGTASTAGIPKKKKHHHHQQQRTEVRTKYEPKETTPPISPTKKKKQPVPKVVPTPVQKKKVVPPNNKKVGRTPQSQTPTPRSKNKVAAAAAAAAGEWQKVQATPPAPTTKIKKHPPVITSKKVVPKKYSPSNTATLQKKHRPKTPPENNSKTSKKISTTTKQHKQRQKYRDPFELFESVMKVDYGDNYKEEIESGWQESKGTPGLAQQVKKNNNAFFKKFMNNPFKVSPSAKEFKKLDANKSKSLSYEELRMYFVERTELWEPLLNLGIGLSRTECVAIATDVAFSLSVGENNVRPKYRKTDKELSKDEFDSFFTTYVVLNNNNNNATTTDTEAANNKRTTDTDTNRHDFFLRALFCAFDKNGDGVWVRSELADFVDTVFYSNNSGVVGSGTNTTTAANHKNNNNAFVSGRRLPPKAKLISTLQKRLDTNNTRCLQYDEVHDLLDVAAAHVAKV